MKKMKIYPFSIGFICLTLNLFVMISEVYGKSCPAFLDGRPTEITELSIDGLEEYYVHTGYELGRELNKLPSEKVKALIDAFNANGITRVIMVYERLYIKGYSFYFSPEDAEIFFNDQLLKALQLRAGLKSLFPDLEIVVNPKYVNGKIKKDLILSFYKEGDQNIFSIGYFTDYIRGRMNAKSETVTNHVEVNVNPGVFRSLKGLFRPTVEPNTDFLDFQFQAIFERIKYGRDIYTMMNEPF
jgi:hypothetical protein